MFSARWQKFKSMQQKVVTDIKDDLLRPNFVTVALRSEIGSF